MAGVLYIVPTPIGNLQDITERARNVLRSVATIAAEDTRQCRKLLHLLDIAVPELIALHEHNEAAAAADVVARLQAGQDVALVSDAGTPLISDPGHLLLRAVWQARLAALATAAAGVPAVVPLPGPSAVLTALSACPLPLTRFCFEGFLPSKAAARRRRLGALLAGGDAVVAFEAPHRIYAALLDIDAIEPTRPLFVARELTKLHESLLVGSAAELARQLQAASALRGEFVLVIGAVKAGVDTVVAGDKLLRVLLEELPPAQAARLAARASGRKKSQLYASALQITAGDVPERD